MIKILWESLTTKYFQFSGRASRKEYWTIYLLVSLACYIVFFIIKNHDILGLRIVYLSVFILFFIGIPSISVTVRRLHDINFSGWWFLTIIFFEVWGNDFLNNSMKGFVITIIPDIIVGFIKGTPTTNKYGKPPVN